MDPTIKAKWIELLRFPGENPETEPEEYCCLANVLYAIREMLGITNQGEAVLFGMNDHKGKSFAEIADYIEEHF